MAAVILAIMILSLAMSINSRSLKARFATKIDIVKPIPPSNPAPNSFVKVILCEILAIPNLSAIQLNETIPIGFPKNNPKKIPIESGFTI